MRREASRIVTEPRSVTPARIVRERRVDVVEVGLQEWRDEGEVRIEGFGQRRQVLGGEAQPDELGKEGDVGRRESSRHRAFFSCPQAPRADTVPRNLGRPRDRVNHSRERSGERLWRKA